MGWLGGHHHSFESGVVFYKIPDDDIGFRKTSDERKARLEQVLPDVKSKMRWEYDFGDGWEHDVVVEANTRPRT
jgi:pRiA4b ORF-3-like protein